LATLVGVAKPVFQQAERVCPRRGRGRRPEFPDWAMALLIMVCVVRNKKSKSAQYRFLVEHQKLLLEVIGLPRLLSRSSYFERYRRAWRLYEVAIELQGKMALREGIADARVVAVDKSLLAGRGPRWHQRDRRAGKIPKRLGGIDRDSTWGYSEHDGWVQGYSYETVVTATKGSLVFPLLGSADTAAAKEYASFGPKIDRLPEKTRVVLADSGYDKNDYGERIEYDTQGRRTGRRFVCPLNIRNAARCRKPPRVPKRCRSWQRRQQRNAFLKSHAGRRLFSRRAQTVEPFHDWFKQRFGLEERVWHRGLDNNRTQLLAALFSYQLLVRYNHRLGRQTGQIAWILDSL
jgi:hypothetical protein